MKATLKRINLSVIIVFGVLALVAGIFLSQHLSFKKRFNVTQFHGTYLHHPRTINHFSLTGIDQKPFGNSELEGQWTLIFFGFTQCSYVCPTTLAELGKMYRILEDRKVKFLPRVVMISVDSERDTTETLGHYVQSFQSSFYGAMGMDDSVQSMAHEMGIAYAKIANIGGSDAKKYDIEHSGAIMLFNPKGELTAFFTTPHRADLLAKDYMMLTS